MRHAALEMRADAHGRVLLTRGRAQAGFLEAWSLGGAMSEEGDSCVHSLAQIKPRGDEVRHPARREQRARSWAL